MATKKKLFLNGVIHYRLGHHFYFIICELKKINRLHCSTYLVNLMSVYLAKNSQMLSNALQLKSHLSVYERFQSIPTRNSNVVKYVAPFIEECHNSKNCIL